MRPVFALALVASLAVACGGGGTTSPKPADPKPVDLSRFLPGVFETDKAGSGDPRLAHIRIWTDAAVRVAPKWKDDLTDQVDYVNQLLQPLLGIRLQIDAWKDWDRTGDLHQALGQLEAVDAGSDVAWVIGYTGPNDVATKAMSELGDAHVLGHHVVVHGWADKPETDLVALSLPAEMSDAQRQEVLGAHRRHKQAAVLLHMLAITAGAVSTQDPSWLDNPLYSTKQVTFPDRTRELMALAFNDRLSGGTDQTVAPKLLELLDKEWGGWVAADREQVMAALKHVVDVAHAGKTASDVPAEAYPQYERIKTLVKSDPHQALVELDNLLAGYPGNATLYLLKCDIMLIKPGVKSKETRLACAHVSDIAPGDPSPHIHLALKLVEAGDNAAARTELSLAETQVANLEHGTDEAWHGIIDAYMAIGSLTWAEEALAKSKLANDPVGAKIAQTRSRYGVPRGTKLVTPEHEVELVAAARTALNLIYANKHDEARALLAKAETKWHDAPGLLAARCDLALRDGDAAGARGLCARAVQIQPDESWALYLGGVIALKDTSAGGAQAGIALLKRAITADPDLAQPWHALGQAYQRIHDQAAYDKLSADYATRFQQNLPQ
jgi:predicted Zn-dependent protease